MTLSVTLGAQWPAFRSADLPRRADGKVDLTAPTPRMPDGTPDLSGVWNYAGVLGFRGGPPPSPPGTPPPGTTVVTWRASTASLAGLVKLVTME